VSTAGLDVGSLYAPAVKTRIVALLLPVAVAVAGCGDEPVPAAESGEVVTTSTAPAEALQCDGGADVQGFRFDQDNAAAPSARAAAEVALGERASVAIADFEGPVAIDPYEVFTYRSDGKARVRVTVEDVGGSWRVQRLEGCPPYLDEG
jgi:hypothetical protein